MAQFCCNFGINVQGVPWWDAAAKADQVGRTGRLFSLPLALIPREVARPKTLPLNSAVIEVDVTEYPLRLGKEQRRKWLSRISSAIRWPRRAPYARPSRPMTEHFTSSATLSLSLFLSHVAVGDYVRAFSFPWRRRCQLRRTMKRARPLRWRDRPMRGIILAHYRLDEVYNWLTVETIRKAPIRETGKAVSLLKAKIVPRGAISFLSIHTYIRLLKLDSRILLLIHPSSYDWEIENESIGKKNSLVSCKMPKLCVCRERIVNFGRKARKIEKSRTK